MDKKLAKDRRWTSEQWEARIGEQIRRARLDLDYSQAELAERANVALGAVKRLESGGGSTLRTLIRVTRSLDIEAWLEQLYPDPEVSPMAMLRAQRESARPKRASRTARQQQTQEP